MVAGPEVGVAQDAVRVVEVEPKSPGEDVDRLLLPLVPLERQPLAGLDDDELAGVAIGLGPDQLVAPGLRDASGRRADEPEKVAFIGHAHEPRTSRSPASSIASRIASEVASV